MTPAPALWLQEYIEEMNNHTHIKKPMTYSSYNKLRQAVKLLKDIKDSLYYGEDLKYKDVRKFYESVWNEVVKDIDKITDDK